MGKKTPLSFDAMIDQPEAAAQDVAMPHDPPLPPADADDELTLVMPTAPRPGGLQSAEDDIRLTRVEAPMPARLEPRKGRGIYWLAAIASALWLGGMIGVALAYQTRLGYFDNDAFAAGVFALMALAPMGLIWLSVYAVRQGGAFIAETRRSQAYADNMLAPAAQAAAETGSVVEAIRGQIEIATATAAQARAELVHLRDVLAEETGRLVESANLSTQTAHTLVENLGRERHELAVLTGALDGQAGAIAEAITRHARMVAEASDLAQTQIAEAEAVLAARAGDLTVAAASAGDAARVAGDDLSRQAARLEAATGAVADQVQIAEDTLGQQRAALVAIAADLRVDQEDLAVAVETQRAQLAEILVQSGESAIRLGDAANEGAKALRDLAAEAAQQFHEVAETAQSERDMLGATALQSLGAFSEAAAFERRALEEQTRLAIDTLQQAADEVHRNAETTGETARAKIEQLSEAAFAAGQKADSVFESRIEEARALIEHTAALVDEAGQRSAQRLDASIGEARQALADLEKSLSSIEDRTARLPADAEARAVEIRQALEHSTQALLDTARQASEETQAIDQAFQERVKRNYEMLSEAVRLMGVIGGGASARASGVNPRPASPRPFAAAPILRPAPSPAPAAQQTPAIQAPAATDGTARSRLKLTPAVTDDLEDGIFAPIEAPAAPAAPAAEFEGDEWTWKDLLGAVDEGDAVDEASLADVLIREIEALALDPTALLPRARIDEVLSALGAGNTAAARDSVRRLAPAAIRRLSRRVLADKVLRAQTERFVQSYQSLLHEAMQPGAEVTPHVLLSSDAGRAYLLLDAAVGDLN